MNLSKPFTFNRTMSLREVASKIENDLRPTYINANGLFNRLFMLDANYHKISKAQEDEVIKDLVFKIIKERNFPSIEPYSDTVTLKLKEVK